MPLFSLQTVAFAIPILAQFDWEQVFYVLIPLVYVAAQFFGSDKKKAEKRKDESPPASEQKADPSERLRRVQEEVRRRIAEAREEARAATAPDREELREARDAGRSRAPESPRMEPPPALREESPPPVPPVPRREPAAAAARLPEGDLSPIERQLREQRERVARSRERREAAFAQAHDIEGQAVRVKRRPWDSSRPSREGAVRDQVLGMLASAESARSAIVLSEVLGPPKSLRSGDSFGHSID